MNPPFQLASFFVAFVKRNSTPGKDCLEKKQNIFNKKMEHILCSAESAPLLIVWSFLMFFSHRHGGHWEAKLDMISSIVVATSDLDISVQSQTKVLRTQLYEVIDALQISRAVLNRSEGRLRSKPPPMWSLERGVRSQPGTLLGVSPLFTPSFPSNPSSPIKKLPNKKAPQSKSSLIKKLPNQKAP